MQQHYDGSWDGSPQDYEDVVGPNRSGGMETVTSGPKLAGLLKDEGTAGVRVPAKPNGNGNGNGNGLSGGAARRCAEHGWRLLLIMELVRLSQYNQNRRASD
jgi:hypothetical protein